MQVQRELQIQIENQGKRLQMMFEKQIEMDDSKLKGSSPSLDEPPDPLSSVVLPSASVDNLETTNEDHEKFRIDSSTSKTLPEETFQDASTKQKGDDAKDADEHELGDDQFPEPLTKRVKS